MLRRSLIAVCLLAGCVAQIQDLIQPDGGATDGSNNQDGPAGTPTFKAIQSDLDSRCSLSACHGGSQAPVFQVMPSDRTMNCATFKSRVNSAQPASSVILTKAVGQGNHMGGAVLTVGDATYQRWLGWIEAGQTCD